VRGLVLEAVGAVALRHDLPDPVIEAPSDAVVAVHAAGLCGSDLHPYLGREPARLGVVAGHEAVGEVVAVGHDITEVAVGDRVLVPFTTCCGACSTCRRGLTARCLRGQLFGWGDPDRPKAPALHGGQAELLRVPHADATLVPVPDGVDDATAVLLTDNLPTGWEAVARAAPRAGEPLLVVGLGSVGLCAVVAASHAGATPIVAVDPVADRRARAARLGAVAAAPEDAVALVHEALATGGPVTSRTTDRPVTPRTTDRAPAPLLAAVDAAGTLPAQRLAFELLAPGGTLSVIAVPTDQRFAFTPPEAYDRNVTVRAGRASVRATLERLLPRVTSGEVRVPTQVVVTHLDVPLDEGPELYRRFAAREDGLVKAVFRP
jgi:alcohol dehydrogenase